MARTLAESDDFVKANSYLSTLPKAADFWLSIPSCDMWAHDVKGGNGFGLIGKNGVQILLDSD